MGKLSNLRVDRTREAEGVEVKIGDSTFVVARASGPEWDRTVARVTEQFREKAGEGELTEEDFTAILQRALAEYAVKSWDLTDDDDQPIPLTPDEAFRVFTDPELHDAYEAVRTAAFSATYFRKKRLARAGKTSRRS